MNQPPHPDTSPRGAAPAAVLPPAAPSAAVATDRFLVWVAVAAVLVGVAARLKIYFEQRSFWFDEISLALNLGRRSWSEFFEPLGNYQVAPPGFLLLQKAAFDLFGPGEYALRVLPLVCGLALLPCAWLAGKRILGRRGALVTLAIVAVLPALVHYSNELKQYSLDALVSVLLVLGALRFRERDTRGRRLALAGGGALAVWFSHPAVFVLAAIGVALAVDRQRPAGRANLRPVLILAVLWIASFAVYYVTCLSRNGAESALSEFFEKNQEFLNVTPLSLSELRATTENLQRPFTSLCAAPTASARVIDRTSLIAAFALVLGCLAIPRPRRVLLALLGLPILLAMLASALHRYPLGARLLLFNIPLSAILMGGGVGWLLARENRGGPWAGRVLVVLLLFLPLLQCLHWLATPVQIEELRPCLEYVARRHQQGDRVHLYYGANPGFDYYSRWFKSLSLDSLEVTRGKFRREQPAGYLEELESLRGRPRVWMVFSHVHQDEDAIFIGAMDRLGKRLEQHVAVGASAVLYDLSTGPGVSEPR